MSQSELEKAPFNEREPEERDFEMSVEFTMKKSDVKVTTNRYEKYFDDEYGYDVIDTSHTEWDKVYKEDRHTIQELLQILEAYILQDLERYKGSKSKELLLMDILEDCRGWEVTDEAYYES